MIHMTERWIPVFRNCLICPKCKKTRIENYDPDNDNGTYQSWPDKWKCKCNE